MVKHSELLKLIMFPRKVRFKHKKMFVEESDI